jgi:hypothetical protein
MALLEFRSKAAGGFFMMPDTFRTVCKVLGRAYSESGSLPPEDIPAAESFAKVFLAAGDCAEIDIEFRAPVPVSNALEVVYSKRSRSLLRDTALQPLFDRLVGPAD